MRCRLKGQRFATHERVWGARRIVASLGPLSGLQSRLDIVLVKSKILVLGTVCLIYLGLLDLA